MFDAKLFSEILQKISNSYNSMSEFSEKSEVNRTYLSKYINMKLDNPPTPKILEKIATSSHGIITYAELMEICGYLKKIDRKKIKLEEYDKSENILLTHHFSSNDLEIIREYLLSDSSTANFEEKFNNFEKLLNSLDENRKKFLLDFTSQFLLNVAKEFVSSSDKTREIFNKSTKLLDETNISQPKFHMCPVYGKISAGLPNWAEECLEGYLPIDPNLMGIVNPEECFFLRVARWEHE